MAKKIEETVILKSTQTPTPVVIKREGKKPLNPKKLGSKRTTKRGK